MILALFDGSRPLDEEDEEIFNLIRSKNAIVLLTKSDLPQAIDPEKIKTRCDKKILPVSAKTGDGIENLFDTIIEFTGIIDTEPVFIRDEREADILRRAAKNLEESRTTIKTGIGIDFVSIDLRAALELLSELTGESVSEDILNEIFSKFCIGK